MVDVPPSRPRSAVITSAIGSVASAESPLLRSTGDPSRHEHAAQHPHLHAGVLGHGLGLTVDACTDSRSLSWWTSSSEEGREVVVDPRSGARRLGEGDHITTTGSNGSFAREDNRVDDQSAEEETGKKA